MKEGEGREVGEILGPRAEPLICHREWNPLGTSRGLPCWTALPVLTSHIHLSWLLLKQRPICQVPRETVSPKVRCTAGVCQMSKAGLEWALSDMPDERKPRPPSWFQGVDVGGPSTKEGPRVEESHGVPVTPTPLSR